jgi:hypothetical protein
MPRNNSLWAVIEELRAEIEQIETHYENAMQSLQELDVENAKQKQIIEEQKSSMDMFMSGAERGNREDKAEERRQHEKEQEEGDNHE